MAHILRRQFFRLARHRKTYDVDLERIEKQKSLSLKSKVAFFFGASALGGGYYLLKSEQERRAIRVTFGGIVRFFRSSFIACQIAADYNWSLYGVNEGSEKYFSLLSEIHERSASKILNGCLKNGGLYVKLGQGLIIMDHILPKEYIKALIPLQDKCLAHDIHEVYQLFQEDFGKGVDEMFEEFDPNPIAAASLAQVFKAKLKSGETVAVKTQYIDLQDRFIGDMMTLKILLIFAAKVYPDFDFGWVLNELRGTLEKELNFLNEAKNSEICAQDLSHLPFVYVPKVYWDFSSSRVLTTEMIDGDKISDKESLLKKGFSLADIDRKLFKTFSEQIFYTGFVHADPHSGNILVRKKNNEAQLVILDHGLYEVVPPHISESLRNLWKAMVLNNHPDMKKYAMELGIKEADYRLFCIALGQRYIPAADSDVGDSDIVRSFFSPQNIKKKKFKMSKEDRILIQRELTALRSRSMQIFKDMPQKLMLVTRNINTIRSIARQHGDPINRYKEMARCASYGTFEKRTGLIAYAKYVKDKADFEFRLWWGGVKSWIYGVMIKLLSVNIVLKDGATLTA